MEGDRNGDRNADNNEEELPPLEYLNNGVVNLVQRQRQYRQQFAALAEAEDNFIQTISSLNHENKRLEDKMSEADAQNNLLQMHLKFLNHKMENLENFMVTLSNVREDLEAEENVQVQEFHTTCPNCGFNFRKTSNNEIRDPSVPAINGVSLSTSEVDTQTTSTSDMNPLMVELILSRVMDFLDVKSLLKARLVSKLWLDEASFQLKDKFSFTLNFNNIQNISKFIACKSDWHFTKLKLDLGFVINPFRPHLESFFSLYGPTMTQFSLTCEEEFSNRIYAEEVRAIFFSNFQALRELELTLPTRITERETLYERNIEFTHFVFPNLTSIALHQSAATDGDAGFSVHFTKDLLKMAPNLRSFRIATHNKPVLTRVLLSLADREIYGSITKNLLDLYVDAFITQQHMELLTALDLKLRSLQLSYFCVDVRAASIEGLLSKHRMSLEELILGDYQKRGGAGSNPLVVPMPIMTRLKTVTFIDPLFPDRRNLVFSQINYSERLPRLERLAFEHEKGKPCGPHYFSDFINENIHEPCLSLRELRFLNGLESCNGVGVVASAAKLFPNVATLVLANTCDSVLKAVWTNLTSIVELRLELYPINYNVDSILTGVPNEVCRKIQERNLYVKVDTLGVIDVIRTEPSICNLTRLRTLRIEGLPANLVTSVTGYLALSQMKSLSSISIKSDVATISRECRRIIGERISLTLFDLF